VYYKNLWMDYGIFIAYILFNFALVFFCSWLYLQSGSRIKSALSPAARKERKLREREQRIRRGGKA
jgi:ATP-binding cassette, subfamily G (WHITE), member 2, SNQ2